MPLTGVSPAERVATAPLPFAAVLRRCAAAGAFGGAASAAVSLLVVGPVLSRAVELEGVRDAAAGAGSHAELVSRPVQVLGGVVTTAVVGVAIGVVFAVLWSRLRSRLPAATDFGSALLLGAAGFVCVSLVPWLKYPADPPGVGDASTVGGRTWAYLTLVAAAVLLAGALLELDQLLRRAGRSASARGVLVATGAVAALVLLLLVWPADPDSVPADMPAELLWQFRLASLAARAARWGGLAFAAGFLLDRAQRAGKRPNGAGAEAR